MVLQSGLGSGLELGFGAITRKVHDIKILLYSAYVFITHRSACVGQ